MQVGLTLMTHFGMGMVIFTSSTWNGNRELAYYQYTRVEMGLTFLPIVCFGPNLILNFPVPSAKVNCGVTYTVELPYCSVVCVCVHVCICVHTYEEEIKCW